MKRCKSCECEKPVSAFPLYTSLKGELRQKARCFECARYYDKTYKKKRRDNDPIARQRELDVNKSYRAKYSDGYRQHQIKKREKALSKYQTNIIERLSRICGSAKTRAARKGLPFDLTPAVLHVVVQLQGMNCAATGIPLQLNASTEYHKNPYAPSLDRKDSDKGYTLDNIQIVCTWYNMMKNEWSDKDVREFVLIAYRSMFKD
jgi:hypothetical protein